MDKTAAPQAAPLAPDLASPTEALPRPTGPDATRARARPLRSPLAPHASVAGPSAAAGRAARAALVEEGRGRAPGLPLRVALLFPSVHGAVCFGVALQVSGGGAAPRGLACRAMGPCQGCETPW